MSEQVRIESLADYIKQVVDFKPVAKKGTLLHEEFVFRGLSSNKYGLMPALGRKPSEEWFNTLTFVEKDLVSEAQQKYPDIFKNDDLPVTKIAKLQHFGIPTRMMDVSSNALVALYFACQNSRQFPNDDGEVVVFSAVPVSAISPVANIVADTYRLTQNARTAIENYYYRGIKQDYAVYLQYPNWENEHENAIASFCDSISRPFLVSAIEGSQRQKNQQGKYILFPNRVSEPDKDGTQTVLEELVSLEKDDPLVKLSIIVPAKAKDEILRQLPVLGIGKEILFADNVDVVFAAVKEHQESRYR